MGGYEWLALAMFVGFMILLLLGYPVAFSFAGAAIVFGAIGVYLGIVNYNRLWLLSNLWFGTMSNFTLLAVPYFIFLGAVFEKTGMAEELLTTVGIALGPLRGGMALAIILVGTLLAATTGVVAATVIVMGMLTMPIMLRYGYNKQLASGVIIATGTLAQVIPPSIVLVVLADQLGVSVGDLFIGSVIPGIMLSGSFALYVIVLAFFRPHMAPPLPLEVREGRRQGVRYADRQSSCAAGSSDFCGSGEYLFWRRYAYRGWCGGGCRGYRFGSLLRQIKLEAVKRRGPLHG